MATIRVKGMKQMRKALKEVEGGLSDLKEAHQKIGREAAEDIKAALPVKTGAWRAAVKDSSTKTMAKIVWGREGKGRGVRYAGWQEFGGKVHWRSRGGGRAELGGIGWRSVRHVVIELPKVPEGRYVYPTAERYEAKYLELHNEYVGGLLRKAGLK